MNLLQNLPSDLSNEVFEDIITSKQVRIERIISKGHTSPQHGWYDQEEHEWVLVLHGAGEITFENHSTITLYAGDHITIPAHTKHKVSWTKPDEETIWLAVFYRER